MAEPLLIDIFRDYDADTVVGTCQHDGHDYRLELHYHYISFGYEPTDEEVALASEFDMYEGEKADATLTDHGQVVQQYPDAKSLYEATDWEVGEGTFDSPDEYIYCILSHLVTGKRFVMENETPGSPPWRYWGVDIVDGQPQVWERRSEEGES